MFSAFNSNILRVYSWNANGVKKNLEELKDSIIFHNPDLIGIQKTHLRPPDRISIPNYTCPRSDRLTHRGRGTAIFVKNSIKHHAILSTSNTFENTTVLIQLGNNTKVTMACIYKHPPHGSINVTELDAILAHNNRTFLFGDFNAKHSSWNPGRSNATGNILSHWAVSSAIDIIAPDTPTHFNHNAPSTVIDIGFAANFSHSNVFTVNELSSDHNPVIFDFVTNCQLPPLLQTLKTTNWIKFQEILHYNMPGNPTVDNLDQAVQNFSNIFSNVINTSTLPLEYLKLHTSAFLLTLESSLRLKIDSVNFGTTRYPLYKREVNALIRQIRIEINVHKNRTWKNRLSSLNVEDNSLYNMFRWPSHI
ncbi:probable RNA-directed DNA polymerase from transposon X-element [Trichonephila clavipes]|nr:probable RNA-directed DNA polymerase from transposon X-element [Trichonephila clavipes]